MDTPSQLPVLVIPNYLRAAWLKLVGRIAPNQPISTTKPLGTRLTNTIDWEGVSILPVNGLQVPDSWRKWTYIQPISLLNPVLGRVSDGGAFGRGRIPISFSSFFLCIYLSPAVWGLALVSFDPNRANRICIRTERSTDRRSGGIGEKPWFTGLHVLHSPWPTTLCKIGNTRKILPT